VIVGEPQPSVAEALPKAALIVADEGLQPSATTEYVPVNVGGFGSMVHVTVLEVVAVLPH